MSTTNEVTTTQAAPADTPQTVPTSTLTPEAAVDALRALRAQLGDVTPLTSAQRKALVRRAQASNPVLQASINIIGAFDRVAQAVGQPASDVRQKYDEANRWTAVEDELRTLLNGVSSANLIRRDQVSLIAAQAAGIGSQLARDPANALLVPHLQEIKRLKSYTRRKKRAHAPGTPRLRNRAVRRRRRRQTRCPRIPVHREVISRDVTGGRETGRVLTRPVLEFGRCEARSKAE